MAKTINARPLQPVIDAAQEWIHECLISDTSIFSTAPLWTADNVDEVRRAFVENPDLSNRDFLSKLKGQMTSSSPSAQRLMAELLWALLLFPSNIGIARKRQQVVDIWSMSGENLAEDVPLLEDQVLSGIGSGGPGFNNNLWRELVYLITLVEKLKQMSTDERRRLFSDYDRFTDWISNVPAKGDRQYRHMLRFFSFPDRVERMSSNRERQAVLAEFDVAIEKDTASWSDRQLDEALLALRDRLQQQYPGQVLDFYESPLVERWKTLALASGQANIPRRFWVEKTNVKGRPHREFGDNALGKSLWSPQRDKGNKDIYRLMREVQPGDVVFHFIDNTEIVGFSVAKTSADPSFIGLPNSEWAGRTAYRIELQDYRELKPPIDLDQFLRDPRYSALIEQLLRNKGLFFNRRLDPNQGSYITEAPLELVQIWNDIHLRSTDQPLMASWNIPPLEPESLATRSHKLTFNHQALEHLEKAVYDTNFRVSRDFLARFVTSLISKPFLILTGNSGTGKTKLADLFVRWICGSAEDRFALVPVGADWTDNRNVLGFVNHLRMTKVREGDAEVEVPIYQSTNILDLLLEAVASGNEMKPYFLILDEMNLSHVERYFADFLSALELKAGRLLLHREGRPLPKTIDGLAVVPNTLVFPQNVFVIGTVNVDETTYMFSPKVLDRANVMEFRVSEDAPSEFLKTSHSVASIRSTSSALAEAFLDLSFRARGLKEPRLRLSLNSDLPQAATEGLERCHSAINDLFLLMQRRHQEFAFRTITEIVRFLTVDHELFPQPEAWDWQRAMDAQILQKVLPKLHGSKRKIGSLLASLAKYCEQGDRSEAALLLEDETKAEIYLAASDKRHTSPRYKQSYSKLSEMMDAVRRDQFVSFIQ